MVNKYSPSLIYQCTDAGWDGVINYSADLIPVIVLFSTPDNGTNKMRKQKYDTIKRSELPDCTHMNSQQEGVECQHCRPKRKLPIVSVPILYNKILRLGDRKERAGSVWEKKGTVRKRRRERRRLGEWLTCSIGQMAEGRS